MILYPHATEYPASNATPLMESEKVLKIHFPAIWKLKNHLLSHKLQDHVCEY